MRGKSRDYHPAQQTKTGFALSREEANKRKMAPSYHSEKRTKKKANFALSREEADKEGEDSELADDGG